MQKPAGSSRSGSKAASRALAAGVRGNGDGQGVERLGTGVQMPEKSGAAAPAASGKQANRDHPYLIRNHSTLNPPFVLVRSAEAQRYSQRPDFRKSCWHDRTVEYKT